jgi:thiamine-monophosphate kinase
VPDVDPPPPDLAGREGAAGDPAAGGSLAALGEFGLLERLTRGLPGGRGVEVGIGDDAAVLALTPGRRLVATTDVLVEGVHFSSRLSTPSDWGWKAIAVNLSDLAAMGARPRAALLALTVPGSVPPRRLDHLYEGVAQACSEFGAPLVGGDVSAGPVLSLAVTALGEVDRPVTRGGARPGDRLAVTGPLGAAAAGLALLDRDDPPARELLHRYPGLAAAHRRPRPELAAGPRLARAGARAMIDVSDGLAADALHLAEASGLGLVVRAELVPLAPGVAQAARLLGRDAPALALGGGEDYVLAVALPPEVDDPEVTACGEFVADPDVRVARTAQAEVALAGLGYDHLRGPTGPR